MVTTSSKRFMFEIGGCREVEVLPTKSESCEQTRDSWYMTIKKERHSTKHLPQQ